MRGDACVWVRGKGDMRVHVCAHVDDLLIVGKPEATPLMSPVSTSYCAIAAIESIIITDDWLTVGERWISIATESKKLSPATHLPFSRRKLPYFGVTNR
jgi:hypothetical protein